MPVNHQHLRAFHAIATEGSFGRAARRLNVAQPTLSQQIKALEARHQAALFENRRPPLRLTPLGQALLGMTQRLFATSVEIDELLGDGAEGAPTLVRLGADSPAYVARLASALVRDNPALGLEIRIDNARDTLRRLQDALADAAVVSDPTFEGAFVYEPLFADRLCLVASADHPLAGAAAFPLARIAEERLILREPSSKTRQATERLLSDAEIVPAMVVEAHGREVIREAIAAGLGVSLFFSSECPPDARLRAIPLEGGGVGPKLTGYLVFRAERRRTLLMQRLVVAARSLASLSPLPLRPIQETRAEREKALA